MSNPAPRQQSDPDATTPHTPVRIGVDVGGTFTDLVYTDSSGFPKAIKVSSTPPHFEQGVLAAIAKAQAERHTPTAARSITHGSTVATNALLERRGTPIAFITTEGFRDLLLIGRQNRPDLYALHVKRPEPLAKDEHFFTARERIAATGEVVTPLEDDEIRRLVADVKTAGLHHAAVCLLFSFLDPSHERRLGAALESAGITTTLSSDLLPEFREYERASTTAINAALRPLVETYLQKLSDQLLPHTSNLSPDTSLSIMLSAGGSAPPRQAAREAAKMVLSGPAGGVQGAARLAQLAGFPNVITYDMGGTSTDVAAILNGQPQWTTTSSVDGLPLGIPVYDIVTVGAGGGSIAYLDAGGALRVGPRSAGSRPGPACYGRGGTLPTVTDANLILGRLRPENFLGGEMTIDPSLAREAVMPLADKMRLTLEQTAAGIVEVAEANMASALRAVTTRRGHDPRDFALLSFGGAAGLHAARLAEQLEISTVLIPPFAGVLSALGMLAAPESVDLSRSVIQHRTLTNTELQHELSLLESEALTRLPRAESILLHADCRFTGQSHELRIAISERMLPAIEAAFRAEYIRLYSRAPSSRPLQITTLRARALAPSPDIRLPILTPDPEPFTTIGTRAQLLHQGPTPGEFLLIDPDATTYVPSNWTATTRENGITVLKRN